MQIVHLIFLCTLNFHTFFAQQLENNDVHKYAANVADFMWEKLKEHGVSNLPDVESKTLFNKTVAGHKILGNLYMENGYVLDATGFETKEMGNTGRFIDDYTSIKSKMEIKNLAIIRDFHYEPLTGTNVSETTFGTSIITPHKYGIVFNVKMNLTENKLTGEVESEERDPGSDYLNFDPKNDLTYRLKFIYKRTMPGQPDVVDGLFELWKPIFQGFLEEAMKKIPYPSLRFSTSRARV